MCRLFSPEKPWPRDQKDGFRKGRAGCSKQEGRLQHERESPGSRKTHEVEKDPVFQRAAWRWKS